MGVYENWDTALLALELPDSVVVLLRNVADAAGILRPDDAGAAVISESAVRAEWEALEDAG